MTFIAFQQINSPAKSAFLEISRCHLYMLIRMLKYKSTSAFLERITHVKCFSFMYW
jgi:hypothetical protein